MNELNHSELIKNCLVIIEMEFVCMKMSSLSSLSDIIHPYESTSGLFCGVALRFKIIGEV